MSKLKKISILSLALIILGSLVFTYSQRSTLLGIWGGFDPPATMAAIDTRAAAKLVAIQTLAAQIATNADDAEEALDSAYAAYAAGNITLLQEQQSIANVAYTDSKTSLDTIEDYIIEMDDLNSSAAEAVSAAAENLQTANDNYDNNEDNTDYGWETVAAAVTAAQTAYDEAVATENNVNNSFTDAEDVQKTATTDTERARVAADGAENYEIIAPACTSLTLTVDGRGIPSTGYEIAATDTAANLYLTATTTPTDVEGNIKFAAPWWGDDTTPIKSGSASLDISALPGETVTVSVVGEETKCTASFPITQAASLDTDGDGLTDVEEEEWGTDPQVTDTDGDGLSDGDEVTITDSDPDVADTDGDGLTDLEEYNLGTDPQGYDTDLDGVSDGAEVTAGTDPLVVTVEEVDEEPAPASPNVTISTTSLTLTEGGTAGTATVVLASQPTGDVAVKTTTDSQMTVSSGTLTFTSVNWNVAQTLTVTPVNDSVVEALYAGYLTFEATSTDTKYNGISITSIKISITDDDTALTTPGVTITQSSGTTAVTEGGATDTLTVVLNTLPTGTVTFTQTPSSNLTISPTTLSFTTSNWNVAQTVTVTAVNDSIKNTSSTGSITTSITTTADSTNYPSTLSISSISVTVTDNDAVACSTTLPFTDVPSSEWYYEFICWGNQNGILSGRTSNTYVPDGNVTYAEAAKIIDIALLGKTSSATTFPVSFPNVHSGDWFYSDWGYAENAKVIRNYDSFAYTIDPNAAIPKKVFALYIARAIGATASGFTAPFTDVTDLTDSYTYAIYALAHLNVTVDGVATTVATGNTDSTGKLTGTFSPDSSIDRAEAAAMIYRASISDLAK